MSVKENLKAAKALIDTPDKWGKGEGITPPYDCFCAESACAEVAESQVEKQELWAALERAQPEPWRTRSVDEDWGVHHYNDDPNTTHDDILSLFDRAIEASE